MTEPCIHEYELGVMAADVAHIRKKVDNGLSTEIQKVSVELNRVEKALAEFISLTSIEDEKKAASLLLWKTQVTNENWFTRILTGSVQKIIGIVVFVIILNNVVGTGLGLLAKEKISKEFSGQQAQILEKQNVLQTTLNQEHTHHLPDGRVLYHSGVPDKPAWVFLPEKNSWEKAPELRTEEGVK